MVHPVRFIHRDIEGPSITRLMKAHNPFTMRYLTQYEPYESNYSIKLRGSTDLGYYYATVFVGSPPQKQTVIVDTGSSVSAIPCKQCTNCGKTHSDPYYNPEESKTASYLHCNQTAGKFQCRKCAKGGSKCKFSVTYTEGSSLEGEFMKDMISFGDDYEELFTTNNETTSTHRIRQLEEKYHHEKYQAVFGCTSSETGLFFTQEANGILGLGRRSNSTRHPPNFIDFLAESKDHLGNAFSICLAEEGGYMTIGGLNDELHHNQNRKMHFIPLKQGDQYYVELNNIFVENTNLMFTKEELTLPKGVFFDSGSTMTHMPSHIRNRIVHYLEDYCSACPQGCGSHPKEELCFTRDKNRWPKLNDFFNTFPDLQFQFGNHLYTWRPENYFHKPSSDKEEYCLALFDYSDRIILGASFMKNHDIYFDKVNGMLGFTESDCSGSDTGPATHSPRVPKQCAGPHSSIRKMAPVLQATQPDDMRDVLIVAGIFIGGIVSIYSLLRYRRYRIRKSGPQIPLARTPSSRVDAGNPLSINNIPINAELGEGIKTTKRIESVGGSLSNIEELSDHPPKGRIIRKSGDKNGESNGGEIKSAGTPEYNYQISEDDDDHLGGVEASYEDIKHDSRQVSETGHDESHHAIDKRLKGNNKLNESIPENEKA